MGNSNSTVFSIPSQSVEYYEGHGPIHRNPQATSGLIGVWDPKITTLYEAWSCAVKAHGPRNCLGSRVMNGSVAGPYKFKTYNEINDRVQNVASGLRALGLPDNSPIGIYSQNNEYWVIAEQSCYVQNFICVSIYDTLGADNCQFVVNQAEIPAVFVQSTKMAMILECLPHCPSFKFVITMGEVRPEEKQAVEDLGRKCMTVAELEELGKASPAPHKPPKPQDLCTIMYTSGTTGEPKGVMLTHANVIATVTGGILGGLSVTPNEVHLSYLTMAHIFERIVLSALFANGACAGFYQGDPKKILDDLQELKPSMFFGVPRVFNLLYERINKRVSESSFPKRFLFNSALAAKLAAIPRGQDTPRWNSLVFSKVRDSVVGPNCRRVVSGSAPLSDTVQNFLRAIFMCPVVQGYGLTETAAAVTLQSDNDPSTKSVGGPLVCTEIMLEDVPEMGYLSSNPVQQGEVLMRGLNVFKGYFKNETETAKVLTADGWFHSGDVGQWNSNGTLSIIDRRKNIFKLSIGEYVAAEKLEMVFAQCPYVQQIWIYGNSLHNSIVAIIVPNPENLATVAAAKGLTGDWNDVEYQARMAASPDCAAAVLADLTRIGRAARLASFEIPKAVHLDHVLWSVDNGLLTAAFKSKRPALTKHYANAIEKLYAQVDAAAAATGAGPAPKS